MRTWPRVGSAGLHEDEEIDGEQLAEKMAQQRATMEGTMKASVQGTRVARSQLNHTVNLEL